MSQSPDKASVSPVKSPGLKQYNEQKDKKELQTLSDFDDVIKKAQERLVQKKREFEFFSKLDKAEVSKHMFKEDPQMIPNALRREAQEPLKRIKEKYQEKIDDDTEEGLNALSPRLPDMSINKEHIKKIKENFYAPLTKERIKELHKVLKVNRGNFSLAGIRDDEKQHLSERYRKKYSAMLKDQLRQEVERKRRQENIDEFRLLELVQRNKVTLNHLKIWNKKPISNPDEAAKVQKAFQHKMMSFEDQKLAFLKDTDGSTDICKLIDIHLSTQYRDIDIEKQLQTVLVDGEQAKVEEAKIKVEKEKIKSDEEAKKKEKADKEQKRKQEEAEEEEKENKRKADEKKAKLVSKNSLLKQNISSSSADNLSQVGSTNK